MTLNAALAVDDVDNES